MSYDTQSPEDRQAQLQLDEIQKQLPYVTFEEDGCATFIDGSLTMGMELFPHHLDLSTNNEINALQTALANAMNGLPAGFAVQFELLCSTDCTVQLAKHFKKDTQWAEDMELFKIERELNHHYYLQRAKEGTLRHWRNFLYVNYYEPKSSWQNPKAFLRDLVVTAIKGLKKKTILQEEIQAYRDRLTVLGTAVTNLKSVFESATWYPKLMGVEDWSKLLLQVFNPRLHDLGYTPSLSGFDTPPYDRDLPQTFLFSQIAEGQGGVWHTDGHYNILYTLPEIKAGATIFGLLRLLTRSGIPNLRITVSGRPCEPSSYLREIRRDLNGLRNEERRRPDDMEIKKAIQDRLQEQEEVLQGIQKIFETRIMVHIWDRSADRLAEYSARLAKVGQDMGGAKWLQETYNALPYFFSSVPGWTNDTDESRLNDFKSRTFVDLLPAFAQFDPSAGLDPNELGFQAPVIIENNDLGISGWNPLDNQRGTNLNGIVIGRTRAGKSVAQQHIATMFLPLMPRFTCIDLGESSKTLIEALGGVHYTLIGEGAGGEFKARRINPFGGASTVRPPTDDEIIDYGYVIEQMFVSETQPNLDAERLALLRKSIQDAFRLNPGREIFLDDLYQTLAQKTDAKAKEMTRILTTWVGTGPYAKIVNGPSEINLDNPFVGFELGGIEKRKELIPVLLAIILNHAQRMAANYPGVPKAIWTDEFAVLGKMKTISNYIETAYRTYGKTGTGVWTLSQQIIDYALCAREGKIETFLNNVGQMVIFAQEEAAIDALRQNTSLSENALQRISRLRTIRGQYAEAVIVQRQQGRDLIAGSVVFRSNPIKYWLSSSSSNDRRVRELYVERFLHAESTYQRALQRAILTLAADMPMGFDQAGRGSLTPQLGEELRKPVAGDERPWDPLETQFARDLGLSRFAKPEYAAVTPSHR
ncbi:MAG: hypothetical protein WCQ21_24145 [Verrucomicrobiota bacterium]